MLSGEYNHSIDTKGRVIIPAKFREQLGNEFMITKGLDNCLFVFPKNEWEKFEGRLNSLNMFNKDARELIRVFVGGSVASTLDKTGRTLVPPALRDYANLEKEVVLVGVLNRIEIWDKTAWDDVNANVSQNMDDIAARLQDIGVNLNAGEQ